MKFSTKQIMQRQKFLYYSLFIVVAISLLSFVAYMTMPRNTQFWHYYNQAYITLMLVNCWYVFYLVVYDDVKKKKEYSIDNELLTIIIPCFNEDLDLLSLTLDSVFRAKGNKEIILIDDGSINESKYLIELLNIRPNTKVHIFEKNMGKREALHYAVTNLVSPESFCVITIDSDTLLKRDALIKIAAPLKNNKIGATTGDVQLLNEKWNLLTRMIGTYYWMGLNIYKKAQSSIGNVVCCSGCLSAYRTDLIREIINEFNGQYFLGEKCTHSEDRHLTNLLLKRGYKVEYVPDAVSFTETPSTIRSFCRQQLRWKRGYVRESVYTLSYAWSNQKRLFLQILLWDLTAPYMTLGLRLYMIVMCVVNPSFVFFVIAPIWIIATFLRYLLVVFRAPQKIFGLFLYALFFEAILYWINLYALFTVKNKKWITR